MTTYLERYQNGEYAQVWRDLVALGDAVRQEPVYSDAQAVARETMRRARHNIDLLVERLKQIGFDFESPNQIFVPPSSRDIALMDEFECEIGPLPLSVHAWAEIVGGVNFMGNYPKLSCYVTASRSFFPKIFASGRVESNDLREFIQSQQGSNPDVEMSDEVLEDFNNKLTGAMSSMLNVFSKFFGQDMIESAQQLAKNVSEQSPKPNLDEDDQVVSDPLVMGFDGISVKQYRDWVKYDEEEGPYRFNVSPDIDHKSNFSGGGGYSIEIPSAAADVELIDNPWGELTIVEYVRLSFEWAGFPGLQDYENRDEALLNRLKEGLLPL